MKKFLFGLLFLSLACPVLAEDVEVKAPSVNVSLSSQDAEAKIIGYSVDTIIDKKEFVFSMTQTSDVPFLAKIKAGALRLGGKWKTQEKIEE